MVLVLNQDATKEEVAAVEKKIFATIRERGFNAKKYNGIFKVKGDPLKLQQKLRDEWERNFS